MNFLTAFRYCLRLAIIAMLFAVATSTNVEAQATDVAQYEPSAPAVSEKVLKFSGEVGMFGELYSMSGIEARRPQNTGRFYLRSTLTAWNSVSAAFNVMLSTEGNSARQDINQLDFNPRWRWGQAHIGDFDESFTPLTLGGVKVRGGGVMLTPGGLNLSFITGRTQRSVSSSDNNRSYERTITGGRLGVGRSGGSGFDLYFVSARDKLSSLSTPVDTVTITDTTDYETNQNAASITPQENLVVSLVTNLTARDRKVRWRTEVGVSALTRDRRSAEPEDTDVPGSLKKIFTPRISSAADYAYTTDLAFDISKVTVSAGYHYIGPGYVSLGLSSLSADKREVTAGMLFKHRGGMVKIDGAMQNDNLIDQKSYTTDRTRLSAIISHRLRPRWNATLGIIYTGMSNSADTITRQVDYASWVLRTGHNFSFSRERGLRSLSFDFTYQTSGDQNPLRKSSELDCHSSTLSGTFGVRRNLETVATVALISSQVGSEARTLTQNYSLAARLASLGGKLTSSATMAIGVEEVTTTLRPTLRSAYALGSNLTLTGELESTHHRGGDEASRFNEISGRLILARRF
jgi:hypothetical protein